MLTIADIKAKAEEFKQAVLEERQEVRTRLSEVEELVTELRAGQLSSTDLADLATRFDEAIATVKTIYEAPATIELPADTEITVGE